jgi:hypothetical protein
MRLVFDIDGVLCDEYHPDMGHRQPYVERIAKVNRLYDEGNEIIIFTSRGMRSTNGDQTASDLKYRDFTEKQLAGWGLKYHKLYFGKPNADAYIDNLNLSHEEFFEGL